MLVSAILLYVLVGSVFLVESYVEGEREEAAWDLWRIAGLGLCVVWPLHILIVVAAVLRTRDVADAARISPP